MLLRRSKTLQICKTCWKKSGYALVFNELKLEHGILDLWSYANFFDQSTTLQIGQGGSTLCAIRKKIICHPNEKMKSHVRKIVAVGKSCKLYGVWLR